MSYKYLDEKKIPYKKCGKLIVATNALEVDRLMDLFDRGTKNKVPNMQLVDGDKIREIEPFCKGVKAIWSPETGIVDWCMVTQYYGERTEKCTELGITVGFPMASFQFPRRGRESVRG